jgi:predicted Rossmann-fold nucleotide-binding protein
MEAVSRAFHGTAGRKGCVVGVLPGEAGPEGYGPFPGYPNPWVEIPIRTHLPLSGSRGTEPLSRNHINVLTADVLIALPGGPGTASEVRLALRYGKPVEAFLASRDEIPDLPPELRVVGELQEVMRFLREHLGKSGQSGSGLSF